MICSKGALDKEIQGFFAYKQDGSCRILLKTKRGFGNKY